MKQQLFKEKVEELSTKIIRRVESMGLPIDIINCVGPDVGITEFKDSYSFRYNEKFIKVNKDLTPDPDFNGTRLEHIRFLAKINFLLLKKEANLKKIEKELKSRA